MNESTQTILTALTKTLKVQLVGFKDRIASIENQRPVQPVSLSVESHVAESMEKVAEAIGIGAAMDKIATAIQSQNTVLDKLAEATMEHNSALIQQSQMIAELIVMLANKKPQAFVIEHGDARSRLIPEDLTPKE